MFDHNSWGDILVDLLVCCGVVMVMWSHIRLNGIFNRFGHENHQVMSDNHDVDGYFGVFLQQSWFEHDLVTFVDTK